MAIDLKAIIKSGVATAFGIAGSILDAGSYKKVTAGAYDPAAGVDASTSASTSVNALFGMFEQKEIDGQNVQFGDKKLFIKQTELAIEPQRNDYYIAADGSRWDVTMIQVEPTRNLWMLGVRAHRI